MHRKAHIVSAEANLAYVEDYLTEDEPLLAARRERPRSAGHRRSGRAAGRRCVSSRRPSTPGRWWRSAPAAAPRVSGCSAGMRTDAVLTSVDAEPEHQRLARKAFTDAGFPANRYRLISGKALDVLPVSPMARTTWCSATPTSRSTRTTWPRRCGCSGRAACWPSTTRCAGPGRRPSQLGPGHVAIRELGEQVRAG